MDRILWVPMGPEDPWVQAIEYETGQISVPGQWSFSSRAALLKGYPQAQFSETVTEPTPRLKKSDRINLPVSTGVYEYTIQGRDKPDMVEVFQINGKGPLVAAFSVDASVYLSGKPVFFHVAHVERLLPGHWELVK
jgi:hypothetical protein